MWCITFLISLPIGFEHLHVNTLLIYHIWFCFMLILDVFIFIFMFHLYIWPVLFPGGEQRTRHGLYAVYLIFSLFLSPSFLGCLSTIFNVIIDHMYKGSLVTSVCIGKRKILLLRPTPVQIFICLSITPYCTITLVSFPPLGIVW